ncbi:MAG: hypothetical protein A3J09_00850 [Candidatus Zambryskibacteria bacterium RIFCSPLOWO2_02_FULL_51_21]|uniref:Uncharacterized protein n=1 Tax=Candidatus Zambryskibacteria bacterium RIFCSPHIGHO2_02_FULL_43_37 TaxID=1802749 RepID=A0A1G2TI57_9BACT|nr:MAG: hypothetical protein A2723_00850 [Candidatus Zambryskibacteria bacterium RIFCSPHIGHO2_01_FULL_52_18]OHA96748.1 MAG: hypothetical protein A3D49_02810 [Candidatus Zambryskibacteria bacterium RIFCSPHIGHO2_02_FULL_43_37]OHB07441.1 MAG: hypothetical protein A2944_01880 [Candidatus Zambryskibacteria bacterium RIFCSPLOWO2_01_FULL_52_12]OHB11104.1 MAG: hypothetical protein A3J09_00850 [Candidatus Zambryskibacteria bacterium RIFCSPLOWO2_02_FULL_51_21]
MLQYHHPHLRKRASGRALHPFPASSRFIRILDKVVYAAGLIAIFSMFPQIRVIFVEKDATGLAPITWITLAVLNIPWIIYGFVHKEKPIILVYILWLIVNTIVFVGAVIY